MRGRFLFCFILLHCLGGIGVSQTTNIVPSKKAERLVVDGLAAGKPTDLSNLPEPDRVLSARFIRDLLTNSIKGLNTGRGIFAIRAGKILGDIDLFGAEIPFDVGFVECRFVNQVHLSRAHFKRDVAFFGSSFEEYLGMAGTTVDGNLELIANTFNDHAGFSGLRVAGSVKLSGMFSVADFSESRIGESLDAQNLQLAGPSAEKAISFYNVRIGRSAFFHNAIFDGWVDFSYAEIAAKLDLTGVQFKDSVDFTGIKADVADFRGARFGREFYMSGMTYRDLLVDDLHAFISQTKYSPDVYTNLEAFLKRNGREAEANGLYLAQKRRERSKSTLAGKIGGFLLDILVGYGRRPWLAFIWSAAFIAIGLIVFRGRAVMEPQRAEDEHRPYSPFWYSIDLFLPFVDLQSAGVWTPRRDRRWARTYANIHALLGWILIPIGLAALTGLIR